MKKLLLALLLAPAAAHGAELEFSNLTSGRYAVKLGGLLCTACTRAVVEEVAGLAELESVRADFDAEELYITVKIRETLKVVSLEKRLKRAAKRVNLPVELTVRSIRYRP